MDRLAAGVAAVLERHATIRDLEWATITWEDSAAAEEKMWVKINSGADG